MRVGPAIELGEVAVEDALVARGRAPIMAPGVRPWLRASRSAHRRAAGILEDPSSLRRVLVVPEALAIPLAGDLVLEQLADLGQGEARVVAELLDVAKAVEVRLVVQPVAPSERAAGSRRPTSS